MSVLGDWLEREHPEAYGAKAWLVGKLNTSWQTAKKALRGEPIRNRKAAEKMSLGTGGEVSAHDLMFPPSGRARQRRRLS